MPGGLPVPPSVPFPSLLPEPEFRECRASTREGRTEWLPRLPGGRVANFSVATDESYIDRNSGERQDRTEWHRIVTFQPGLVEMLEKNAKKGRLIYIAGKLQTRRWKRDGEDSDRFSTGILLVPGGRVQFLDFRSTCQAE